MSVLRLACTKPISRIINVALNTRSISVTPLLDLKEINEVKQGNEIIVSATYVESPRQPFLIKSSCEDSCTLCQLNLDVKHTDVLILSQFVRSDGCMLPRRITKLCRKQQKRMSTLVTMAQKSGLMPNLNPSWSKKDPKKRFGWKKYNKYFYDVKM